MKMENIGLLSIPADQYHAHPAVGHSGLVRIMRSPAHFNEYTSRPAEPSPAMLLGTAFHAALLEPDQFDNDFVVVPKFDRRTKDGKASAELWSAENNGKTPLTCEQMAVIQSMANSVRSHTGAHMLLSHGLAEMSGFWIDSESGVECKCRPDFLAMAGDSIKAIVDVKTCGDASADSFARSIATFGYDVQAALYQDGFKALTGKTIPFYFVAVERDAPFAVAAYVASDQLIDVGRAKYRGALQLMKWCQEQGAWPGYQPKGEIEMIDLPRWAASLDFAT